MDIDKMQAGRELDALVAEKVMGLEIPDFIDKFTNDEVPYYSTDIAAAWEIKEHLRINKYFYWQISDVGNYTECVAIYTFVDDDGTHKKVAISLEKTTPLAICRAALKAVDA